MLPTPRRSRRHRLAHAAEHLLLAAGTAALTLALLAVLDATAAQHDARRAFAGAATAAAATAATPAGGMAAAMPMPALPRVQPGALATLSIPRVGLDAVVLEGADAATLRRGPGHLPDTALPGQPGNAAIAGHRDTFFRALRHVTSGDEVVVETLYGRFHYRVIGTRVVQANDLSVLAASVEPVLTLITCYPFWVLGDAPDRYIVRAAMIEAP